MIVANNIDQVMDISIKIHDYEQFYTFYEIESFSYYFHIKTVLEYIIL